MPFSDVLLTVDFDRTLTGPDSTIPQRNIEAIRWFMERGGGFTVNTGRSIPMSKGNILDIVPTNLPLLLYNGSAAYDANSNTLTRHVPLPVDPAKILPELQERFPLLNVEVQALDAHYLMRKDAGWEAFCQHNGCAWRYAEPDQIPGPFIKFALYGQFRENTVASMYQATEEELRLFDEAIGYVRQRYGDQLEIFRACARIVDFHGKTASKLNSARQLLADSGRKILVCVGDAPNDLSMLEGADHAYCPADAELADRFENVCACADGAVADVIYEKIPALLKNNS